MIITEGSVQIVLWSTSIIYDHYWRISPDLFVINEHYIWSLLKDQSRSFYDQLALYMIITEGSVQIFLWSTSIIYDHYWRISPDLFVINEHYIWSLLKDQSRSFCDQLALYMIIIEGSVQIFLWSMSNVYDHYGRIKLDFFLIN